MGHLRMPLDGTQIRSAMNLLSELSVFGNKQLIYDLLSAFNTVFT